MLCLLYECDGHVDITVQTLSLQTLLENMDDDEIELIQWRCPEFDMSMVPSKFEGLPRVFGAQRVGARTRRLLRNDVP